MKHDQSQFQELSSPVPEGERVIWQGKPSVAGLALRSFHIREVSAYFGLLLVWRLASSWSQGLNAGEMAAAALWLIVPAVVSVAMLAALAWAFARATRYTITTKRILFQFGVALPMTMNVPLATIAGAALKTYKGGSGDIPLQLTDNKASYLLLWPHVRPWRLRAVEPMLTAIPDAAAVAARLADVLTGQPGPVAVSLMPSNRDEPGLSAHPVAA